MPPTGSRVSAMKRIAPGVFAALVCGLAIWACGDDDNGNLSGLDAGLDAPVVNVEGGADTGGGDAGDVNIVIPQLTAPVQAVYDEYGFLHVSGKTDEDVFATVGYFHAANRFFFMD